MDNNARAFLLIDHTVPSKSDALMWIKGLGLIKDAAKRPDMAGTADSCSPPRPPASLNPFSRSPDPVVPDDLPDGLRVCSTPRSL